MTNSEVAEYYRRVAPFYDAELKDRGDEDFWSALGTRAAGKRVLELGAGSGRVTALVARGAGRIVALDLSPEMLRLARQRLRGQTNVSLVLGDMRQLPFRCTFDVVIAADDPFSHLVEDEDRARALAAVARHLAPEGRFVLDALWMSPGREREATDPGGRVTEHTVALHGEALNVQERWQCDASTQVCSAEYAYELDGHREAGAAFEARYWSPETLRTGLAHAGLTVDARWGRYDGTPWDEATADCLLVEAHRSTPG